MWNTLAHTDGSFFSKVDFEDLGSSFVKVISICERRPAVVFLFFLDGFLQFLTGCTQYVRFCFVQILLLLQLNCFECVNDKAAFVRSAAGRSYGIIKYVLA